MSLDLEALERVHAAYVSALKRACDVGDSEAAFAEQAVAAIPTLIARARAAERMEKALGELVALKQMKFINEGLAAGLADPEWIGEYKRRKPLAWAAARAALAKEKA